MKLTRMEFETLLNVENSWRSDPVKASDGTAEDIAKYTEIFLKLGEIGLLKVEIRDNQVYGAVCTDKGREFLKDERYESWIPEWD